ncbi:hypothetical protein [Algicella marina]|uniref:Uncharacterized protein n=1 Tax=Algicella marina TaxID=2683284 RepID=A0A6P1T4K4_9RHOB|nr:hypothetical protein [Algicella marina]QHQ36937.1 hypothetical protein GO499_17990 [Algicella marina]
MIDTAALQGHWKRAWIKAGAEEDHDTRVHWLQAGPHYADIRIPRQRPPVGSATCPAELGSEALDTVMQAEGFAGTITVEGGTCTWAREINWRGRPDGIDAGYMTFDESGNLIEDGLKGEYRELWHREPVESFTATRHTGPGLTAILVSSDRTFLFAIGPPVADMPATNRIRKPEEAFQSEYAYGHWLGRSGVAELCTNPFQEGRVVLHRNKDSLTWNALGFGGALQSVVLEETG